MKAVIERDENGVYIIKIYGSDELADVYAAMEIQLNMKEINKEEE